MLVFLPIRVHILADVTSRLLPLPARGLDGKPGRAIFCRESITGSVPRFPPRLSSPGKSPTCLASLTEIFKDTEKKHTLSFGDLQAFFHSIFTVLFIFIHSLCVIVTRSGLLLWIER